MYEEYLTKALSSIIIAKQALKNYEKTNIKDMKNKAAYNTQQAVEYLLKFSIYNCKQYQNSNHNVRQIYSHDLDRMINKYCKPYGIYVPKKIEEHADIYSKWEAESRYQLSYSVRIDSIMSALKETEQWLIQIRPRYKAKLADVNWSCDMAERSQMRKCFLSHLALLCMNTFYIRVLHCEQSHTSVASPS
jgi:HEPN domain-containing protein